MTVGFAQPEVHPLCGASPEQHLPASGVAIMERDWNKLHRKQWVKVDECVFVRDKQQPLEHEGRNMFKLRQKPIYVV